MNKIKMIVAATLAAVLAGALPALADGGGDGGDHELPNCTWEEACYHVGIVYTNDIDGPVAHGLASANTANGIPTIAVTPEETVSAPERGENWSFRLVAQVDCWILLGPGSIHNSASNMLPNYSPEEADAKIVGADRYDTARQAGQALRQCNEAI